MHIHMQTRDFPLTPALAAAVHRGAEQLDTLLGDRSARIHVRLLDTNGNKGGIDKVCLITVRTCRLERVWVVSNIDANLYRAIANSFDQLRRKILAAGGRARSLRRKQHSSASPSAHQAADAL